MRRKFRLLAVLAVMGIFATGAYAFTAANDVPETSAGFGGAAISGYDVSNVSYALGVMNECDQPPLDGDANNYGNCVIGVSFTLTGDNAPTSVTVHFAVPDPTNLPPHLYSTNNGECSIAAGAPGSWDVTCGGPNFREYAAGISTLRIAAAQ